MDEILCDHDKKDSLSKQELAEMFLKAILALAKRKLAEANEEVRGTNNWPCGQSWFELCNTSQHTFRRLAMEEAGIDPKLWCTFASDKDLDIEEIYADLTLEKKTNADSTSH